MIIVTGIAILLLALLIAFLPLNLTKKGKITVFCTTVLLSIIGILGSVILPLWQVILLEGLLALLITYIITQRMPSLFTSNGTKVQKETEQIKPLFNLSELENMVDEKKVEDIFIHQLTKESVLIAREEETIAFMEEKKDQDRHDFPEEEERIKVGIDEEIQVDGDVIEEIAVDVNDKEEEIAIETIDDHIIDIHIEKVATLEEERDEEVEKIQEIEREELEPVLTEFFPQQEVADEELHLETEKDETELLLEARMAMLEEIEEDGELSEIEERFDRFDFIEEASATLEEIQIEEKKDDWEDDRIEELEEIDLTNRKEVLSELDDTPSSEFEDLEELYLKRKKKRKEGEELEGED